MNERQAAAIIAVIMLVVIALAAGPYAFFSPEPASSTASTGLGSAVHLVVGKNTSVGAITFRLNNVTDASNAETKATWIALNLEPAPEGVYNYSLTPAPGDQYLIANVTVTNEQAAPVPFSYVYFALISQDTSVYYPNYAVCDTNCTASVLFNGTLNANYSGDLLVLFSVPAGTQAAELAYTGSNL